MITYTLDKISLVIESQGCFADGVVLRQGVRVGDCVYDRMMSAAIPIDDVDDISDPSTFVWRATICGRTSPPFIYSLNLMDWIECLFIVQDGQDYF